jgi:RNA polymerase sigma-70 factor (ECF subfamily)
MGTHHGTAQELVGSFPVPISDQFVAFFNSERNRVFGSLVLYLGDRGVAEEITQEAFARALVRWKTVSQADRPDAWVYSVAFNLSKSHLRRTHAERRARTRLGSREEAGRDSDIAMIVTVRTAILSLPRRERIAIVLRYYVDLQIRDIALIMNCPEGTVKTLIHRSVKLLERQIGPLYEVEDVQ